MYQNMFKVAQEIALQRRNTGQCTPSDTVCVICAASKHVYTGNNRTEMKNGMMVNIHAEIDAVQQMRAGGDTVAEFILLIGVMTLQPILPCNNCMSFILGQAPENANCQVVLSDRMIPLPQIGMAGGQRSVQSGRTAGQHVRCSPARQYVRQSCAGQYVRCSSTGLHVQQRQYAV